MAKHIHIHVGTRDANRVDKGLADKITSQLRELAKTLRGTEFGDPKNIVLGDEAERLMREAVNKLTQIS